jgi:hypothetical protein
MVFAILTAAPHKKMFPNDVSCSTYADIDICVNRTGTIKKSRMLNAPGISMRIP